MTAILIPSLPSSPWLLQASLQSLEQSLLPDEKISVYLGLHPEHIQQLPPLCIAAPLHVISLSSPRGYLVGCWNELAAKAVADGAEWLMYTGDDIEYMDRGWLTASQEACRAHKLKKVAGPTDVDHPELATQGVVHASHFKRFGFLFHPEIRNWYCDHWICRIYGERVPLPEYRCKNLMGGARSRPRYTVEGAHLAHGRLNELVAESKKLIES